MSYFYGTIKTICLKCRKHKQPVYRNHSKGKGVFRLHCLINQANRDSDKKYISPNLLFSKSFVDHKSSNFYLKNKSKHHLYQEIIRLYKENLSLTTKLKEKETFTGKNKLLLKLKTKYQKLKQNYSTIQSFHKKANTLLIYQEEKLKHIQKHNQISKIIMKKFEQEHKCCLTVLEKHIINKTELQKDIKLLKNVIFYLNLEIEKYKDKLKMHFKTIQKETVNNIRNDFKDDLKKVDILKTWGKVNFHVLGPLLDTYQQSIIEKNQLIQKYKNDFNIFTYKFKEVLNENNNLYVEIENVKLKFDGFINSIKLIEKDISIITKQNDLFTKQSRIQKKKIQEIYNNYKGKVYFISQINNNLKKEYIYCKNEMSNLKHKYDILFDSYRKMNISYEKSFSVSKNMNTVICRDLSKKLKQYHFNKKKLTISINHFTKLQPNNNQLTLIAECNYLKNKSGILDKKLKKFQHKVQSLQNDINLIEISRNSFKHQLIETTLYCEKLIKNQEKFIIEKINLFYILQDQEKKDEYKQYLDYDIIYRIKILENKLKNVQQRAKEEFSLIAKYIKSYENDICHMNTIYQRELQRLKKLLEQKEKIIQKLQKEKQVLQDNLQFLCKVASLKHKNP